MTEKNQIIRSVTADDADDSYLIVLYPAEVPEIGLDGFMIQRMPEFEDILKPEERGASIEWTDDDELILIAEVRIQRNRLEIRTKDEIHGFDISRIPDQDYMKLQRVFESMNFDRRFNLTMDHQSFPERPAYPVGEKPDESDF